MTACGAAHVQFVHPRDRRENRAHVQFVHPRDRRENRAHVLFVHLRDRRENRAHVLYRNGVLHPGKHNFNHKILPEPQDQVASLNN
ncbi:hypothetical protein chiPu_0000655 [Chiloscyllium punctatum]|uniref:Uncharacterized protein n=1 Tax=Chiloscyllium punctatum TaxID=137246 RepID=A0A401RVX8_CHIPU|nr:hypothetical protein [Chiloscyllium punctatum]